MTHYKPKCLKNVCYCSFFHIKFCKTRLVNLLNNRIKQHIVNICLCFKFFSVTDNRVIVLIQWRWIMKFINKKKMHNYPSDKYFYKNKNNSFNFGEWNFIYFNYVLLIVIFNRWKWYGFQNRNKFNIIKIKKTTYI